MGNVNRQTHRREMKPITQPNQGQSNHMMRNQLLEILPRLLQHQTQHNRLLHPVARLEEVVRLKQADVLPMREPLKHRRRLEVPDRARIPHHVQPERPEAGKVDCGVELFHEPGLLPARPHPRPDRERPDEALHEELAREGQEDGVEGDEAEVLPPLAVQRLRAGVGGGRARAWERVGEEEEGMQRVRGRRVEEVEGYNDDADY